MLFNPPQKYYDKSAGFSVHFPLGILSIAASIRDICTVKIFDCLVKDFEINTSENYITYGTPLEKIRNAINEFKPDIVGVSTPFSAQSDNAKEISQICREVNPKIVIVFGGPDTTIRYDSLLKKEYCDYCVVGEGEKTFREFIQKFPNADGIKGLASLKSKLIRREFIDDLDELLLPAYDLVDVNEYLKHKYLYRDCGKMGGNSISIITSRGCPYGCVFCSIKLHMGRKYRYHSPEYVIKNIKFLIDNYKITNFHFEDDNISLNRERFEGILDQIISNKLKIKWDTPNGIRADTLDFNLLRKIKAAGCQKLTLAIESGNQRVLNDVIRKGTSLDYMLKIVKYCKELKIRISAFYVIGFPGEKLEEIQETVDLAIHLLKEYDVLPCLLVATPLYGTELYNICVDKGYINENLSDKELSSCTQIYGEPLFNTDEFSREEMKNITSKYLSKLRTGLMVYSIKHPIFASHKIKDYLPLLKKFLGF